MTSWRVLIAFALAIAAGLGFSKRDRLEAKLRFDKLKPGQKTALVEPLLLPIYLLVIFVIILIMDGGKYKTAAMGLACLSLYLYISVYNAALLCLLPLLRRIISARACAALWLLPNLLYLMIPADAATPLVVITLPLRWVRTFEWVWVFGLTGVMLWQMASHFLYRRRLLKNAELLSPGEASALWCHEQRRHEVRRNIPMLISNEVTSPVTVGCFEFSMRLILPKIDYTPEELALIFRHELRHIQRCDSRTKLFIGFCTAMCWFNPLAWIARRKVSEDLELSCDETVLAGEDDDTRRRYAELLLKSAGGSKGYTTCLSASANSLRYRLKNVIKPGKRLTGRAAVGAALFLLFMSVGTVALADNTSTVREAVFEKAPSGSVINSIGTYNWNADQRGYRSIYGWDETALTEYIASLRVKQVYAGSYTKDEARQLYIDYGELIDGDTVSLTRFELCDGLLFVNIPYDDYGEITFILEDKIDWDYLESLLDFYSQNPDGAPFPPNMMMYFDEKINTTYEMASYFDVELPKE